MIHLLRWIESGVDNFLCYNYGSDCLIYADSQEIDFDFDDEFGNVDDNEVKDYNFNDDNSALGEVEVSWFHKDADMANCK